MNRRWSVVLALVLLAGFVSSGEAAPPCQTVLTAPDAQLGDAFGRALRSVATRSSSARMATTTAGRCGAAYCSSATRPARGSRQKLLPPQLLAGDFFGWSVSVKGDALVVGAPGDDRDVNGAPGPATADRGAAYVYRRNSGDVDIRRAAAAGRTGRGRPSAGTWRSTCRCYWCRPTCATPGQEGATTSAPSSRSSSARGDGCLTAPCRNRTPLLVACSASRSPSRQASRSSGFPRACSRWAASSASRGQVGVAAAGMGHPYQAPPLDGVAEAATFRSRAASTPGPMAASSCSTATPR